MKDLVAGIRRSSSERKALQDGFNKTLQQLEEYCKHVRGNANDIKTSATHIKNTAANIQWELSELRTGGQSQASGDVTANGGSLLSSIGITVDNGLSSLLEGVTKLVHEVQAQMAAAPDPALKRKADEQMFAEFERQRRALEHQKQQGRKEKCFHPTTGQEMYLTPGEKTVFFKSLHLFRPQDVPMGSPTSMPGAPTGAAGASTGVLGVPPGYATTGAPPLLGSPGVPTAPSFPPMASLGYSGYENLSV